MDTLRFTQQGNKYLPWVLMVFFLYFSSSQIEGPSSDGSAKALSPALPVEPLILLPTGGGGGGGENNEECVICSDNPRELVFNPCGHAISCETCGSRMKKCLLCRASILSRNKVSGAGSFKVSRGLIKCVLILLFYKSRPHAGNFEGRLKEHRARHASFPLLFIILKV